MTYSRMLAFIMSKFPGMTARFLQWRCTYFEMLLWFDRAMEIHTGEYEDEAEDGDTTIDDDLEYKDGRWIKKCQAPDK